jgi:hypothetical protein
MYLWRNLPEGQLTAVLRWMHDRRRITASPRAPMTTAGDTAPLPADNGPPDVPPIR